MDNCVNVLIILLQQMNIRHTSKYVKDLILSHPNHPSLLCLVDTLNTYSINNKAIKIEKDRINELPLPSIVQLSNKGGMFYVLKEQSIDKVSYINEKGDEIYQNLNAFLKQWTGVVLLVEKNENSIEPGINNEIIQNRLKKGLTGIVLSSLVAYIFLMSENLFLFAKNLTPFFFFYTLLKIIGFITSLTLLWYELDKSNTTLKNFCSSDKKFNCDAILNSKYASILNDQLRLSTLSLAYFFCTLVFLLLNFFLNEKIPLIAWVSIVTLPIILVSLYYQVVVIKQLCKFCNVIQLVLFMEIITVAFHLELLDYFSIADLLLLVTLFVTAVLVWNWLDSKLKKSLESDLHRRKHSKLKNNPFVSNVLLSHSKQIKKSTDGLGIIFKNDKIKNNVIKVCNPYCDPCAKAHPIIENLRKKGKINLQIIFNVTTDPRDFRANPVRHLLAISELGNKGDIHKALDKWYLNGKEDYNIFSEEFPMVGKLNEQDDKIKMMDNWCKEENIKYTPTIFINGQELPNDYSVNELEIFLD